MKSHERVHAEDALKHLFRCEQAGHRGSLESLAGGLSVSAGQAVNVLTALQSAGLATLKEGMIELTAAGRGYALQVIRAHRLYETYLAQETGRPEVDWHREADVQEHRLSESEISRLAQRLGHPPFDPHGDPIPTADGKVPPTRGVALSDWAVGHPARIVHIEDEPEPVYQQLVALRLYPGMSVLVLEATPQRIVAEIDGEQQVLAPVVATNVTVVGVPAAGGGRAQQVGRLSALRCGDRARVVSISPRCRGAERRRLLDLGIVPDTVVEAEMKSPVGDPTAYRVRQTLVALRREQADLINVMPLEAAGS
ncbi:FeoA domain-containing protein [bacterium]|nr:FeoA domain-containing protein [bacterium]